MERTAPDVFCPTISGGLGLSVLVCTHVWWMSSRWLKWATPGGVQENEPGLFLNGLKSVGVNPPPNTFISASLKEILCSAAVSEGSESNSSTFNKKWEGQDVHQSHMGIKLLLLGKAGVAKVTNNSTQARPECVMKAKRGQAGETLS